MASRVFQQEDVEAFLTGMTTFGTGGGGDPETGRRIFENDFALGRKHMLVDAEDVPDDAFVCSGGIMGSVKSLDEEGKNRRKGDGDREPRMLVQAIRTMEELKGRKVDYLIPFEVGGSNTPVIMSAAAQLGIPAINGDGVGRAAPETQMTSFIGHGVSLTPMPLVDSYGNKIIVMHGNESTYADEIGRFVVVKGGHSGANAHYAMSGAELKRCCVPHILTRALELGKLQLFSFKKGINCVDEVRTSLGADRVFVGKVAKEEGIDKGGFYLTELTVEGTGTFAGRSAHMVLKNETMALWVDGKLSCMFPDYTFMLDPNTGLAYQTAKLATGLDIELCCAPCHERVAEAMQTKIGLASFGAARYGRPDLPYVPYQTLRARK